MVINDYRSAFRISSTPMRNRYAKALLPRIISVYYCNRALPQFVTGHLQQPGFAQFDLEALVDSETDLVSGIVAATEVRAVDSLG